MKLADWCTVRPAPDPGAPTGWQTTPPCNCITCEAWLGIGEP